MSNISLQISAVWHSSSNLNFLAKSFICYSRQQLLDLRSRSPVPRNLFLTAVWYSSSSLNFLTKRFIYYSRQQLLDLHSCSPVPRKIFLALKDLGIYTYVHSGVATKLRSAHIPVISDDDQAAKVAIIPCGYKLVDCPCVDCAGGGTVLLFAQNIDVKLIDSGEKDSFEFSEYVMNSDNNKLRVCVIYRPTYSAAHPVTPQWFLSEFTQHLESVILSPELLLICGDFSIHVDVIDNHDTIAFLDLLESFTLKQHVDFLTHEQGHTLDLLITCSSDQFIENKPTSGWSIYF